MRPSLRLAAGAATVVLAALGLSACAPAGTVDGCTPTASTGTAASAVRVSGAFGGTPTIRFTAPLHADTTQVAVLKQGTGTPIRPAQQVGFDLTLVDASTGTTLGRIASSSQGQQQDFVVSKIGIPGLTSALTCARVGERLAAVIPPKSLGPAASRPQGLGSTDSAVAVIDVRRAYLARADGRDQVMGSGLPAVVLGPDGRPGITLPQDQPPTALRVADLKTGSGAVIRRGDTAVVQYTGVIWKPDDAANGSVFDSSWTGNGPVKLAVDPKQIVKGLATAMTGQRVGSQVLAVLPPSQGYGAQSNGQIPANATLVFVVDVLGKA